MTQHLRLVGLWFVLLAAVACQLQHDNASPDTMETQTQSIIGGAVDTRYPAIGVLMVNKSGQFCTGTLVTPTFILTAAHCISAASNYVKQGSKIFFRIDLPSGGTTKAQYHEAKSLLSHPQYGKTGGIALVNDLGGVVLKAPVSNVQPFPIHFRPVLDGTIVNKQITFLGYGLIGTRPSKKTTKVKHGVQLTLRRLLNDRFEVQDTGKSICSGDSGGPALYQIAGKLRVIGVNSYVTGPSNAGQSYCEGSGFDFRTDVYGDWLQPILNTHGYTCSDNNDCGGCFQCAAGKCVPKVSAPHPSICKPCTSPADCGGNGNICVRTKQGNRCMQACDSLGCCPSSYSCTTVSASTKQCTPTSTVCPPVACQTDAQCGPGEECFQKTCRPKVVTPSPQLCQKCASDADCGTGKCYQYVEGKYCTQPCLADNFCPGGYKCEFVSGLGRQCVPLDGHCKCKDDTICHTGYTCISGSCRVLGGGKYGHACNRKYHICGRNHGCLNHDKGTSSSDLCYAVC